MGLLSTSGNSRTRSRLADLPAGAAAPTNTLLPALLATSPSWCLPLDDPSGSTAQDATANNVDGTYTSVNLVTKAGPFGNYADFTGTLSRVAMGGNTHIPAGGMTFFVCIYPDTNGSFRNIASSMAGAGYEWDFNFNGSGKQEFAMLTSAGANIKSKQLGSANITTGAWQAVMFTTTGNTNAATITLYRNGSDAGGSVTTGAGAIGSGTGLVGHRADGAGSQPWGMDGGMAYATMWNGTVLSGTDITNIFAAADTDGWF